MSQSPIERALIVRSHWLRKARRPHSASFQRIRHALDLVHLVEEHHRSSKNTQLEARRNLVVALVASFEIYWRETFRIAIDREKIPATRFKRLDRISFSLADAGMIVGKKLSLGELVACCHTFQSTESVNSLASDMLGHNFFARFRERGFLITPADKKNLDLKPLELQGEEVFKQNMPSVVKCLRLRHALAHDWPSRVSISRREAHDMCAAISTWNTLVGASFQWQLSELVDEKAV